MPHELPLLRKRSQRERKVLPELRRGAGTEHRRHAERIRPRAAGAEPRPAALYRRARTVRQSQGLRSKPRLPRKGPKIHQVQLEV